MPDTTREQLLAAPIGEWIIVHASNSVTWQNIRGKDCIISLASAFAPDRGNYVAGLLSTVDFGDAFPRYYFDIGRAKAEIEAWLMARDQIPREGRMIKLSEELFDRIRNYFDDRTIVDRRAKILSASIIEAWAAPFGEQRIDRYLFDAIKAYIEPRTAYDRATADLFAQINQPNGNTTD